MMQLSDAVGVLKSSGAGRNPISKSTWCAERIAAASAMYAVWCITPADDAVEGAGMSCVSCCVIGM